MICVSNDTLRSVFQMVRYHMCFKWYVNICVSNGTLRSVFQIVRCDLVFQIVRYDLCFKWYVTICVSSTFVMLYFSNLISRSPFEM
jgi:cellulose synthase/poly-beta-1,6-N-acetylglucosamine synthase-like glycosyltransferase